MTHLYPVFLNLQGKRILIVGGGALALQKLKSLAPCGADVMLVAPEIDEDCLNRVDRGRITAVRRSFVETDLDGVDLVFAATDSAGVNRRVVELARKRGIPANAVDDPAFCDFYTPAVVRRGIVSIAISTDGRFPGLTRTFREVLEAWLPAEDDGLFEALVDLRAELRQSSLPPKQRAQVLRDLIAQTRDRYLRTTQPQVPVPQADPPQLVTRREGTQYDYYIT